MKKVYKETFNQLTIRESAVNSIIKSARRSYAQTSQNTRKRIHRVAVVCLAMVLLFALTIPVLAVEGFDYFGVFKGIFGNKAEIVQENSLLPVVTVLENTFEDIDISITGISGDQNLVYIMMDITRKDGKAFGEEWSEENGFVLASLDLPQLEPQLENEGNFDIHWGQSKSDWWVYLEDDHPQDNTITLAYIVNIATQIEGKAYGIQGETCTLVLHDFRDETSSLPSQGVWKAEFVADYKAPEAITEDVYQTAKLPEWGTSDNFKHEFTLGSFELTPFALRYHVDDYEAYLALNETWDCIYVEMSNGSTIGYKTFDEYLGRLLDGKSLFLSGTGDMRLNEEIIQKNCSLMVFHAPIDLSEVKAVHFGDLSIPIE